MERPATPPAKGAQSSTRPASPPTPEATRRLEENRLRSKALRGQTETAARASGTAPALPRSSSGFVNTDDIQVVGAGSRRGPKRPFDSITGAEVPASNRDARSPAKGPGEGEIRPARKFTKYVDYNFSTMTDTKGGFLSAEDDPWNRALSAEGPRVPGQGQAEAEQKPKHMTAQEWERLQLLRKLQRQKQGPFEPGLSVLSDERERKKCRECGSLEIDFVWEEVLHCAVCSACKEKHPEKYSLLTKTECREDYLLTDPELKDEELLPHLSRPNPHKSHWHDMMLFLRCQVEDYAFKHKWGSAEALDAEFARREADKRRRKEAKFKEKLLDLKRKTRTESYRRNRGDFAGGDDDDGGGGGGGRPGGGRRAARFGDAVGTGGRHVHDWGRAVENEEGMTVKTCNSCGMEVEELEL